MQDTRVVEADGAQTVEVICRQLIGCRGQAHYEIEHRTVLFGERDLLVVPAQRGGEFVVKAGPTKELDMALYSVEATILHGDNGSNQLLLSA